MTRRPYWVSYARLAKDLSRWATKLARNYVGIVPEHAPDEVVAQMLGQLLNVPVFYEHELEQLGAGRVLLLTSAGGVTAQWVEWVANQAPGSKLETAVVYQDASAPRARHVFEVIERPALFEWSWLDSPLLERACMSIDASMTEEPPNGVNDDGAKYIAYVRGAKPRFLPRQELLAIITCRLAKYRSQTADWLLKHRVRYQRLVMMNYATKAERVADAKHCEYKAHALKKLEGRLFVEGNPRQAQMVARLTAIPVLCTGNMRMY